MATQGSENRGSVTRRTLLGAMAAVTIGEKAAGVQAQSATPATMGSPTTGAARPTPQVGFVLWHEQFPTSDLVEFAALAEQAGFDTLWTSDHFQSWQDNDGHANHAWITLALVGARTKTIKFGTAVTCPTFRHAPTQVAQAFATFSELYPDRIFLGTGTGEALNELAGTGHWAPYAERAERWVEAIDFIRQLWTGEWIKFDGKYYQTPVAKLYSKPASPIPLYMAASGKNSARLAGMHGDGWITGVGDLKKKPELMDEFKAGAQAAGKDPAAMPIEAESFVIVGGQADAEAAAQLVRFTVKAWTKPLLWEPDPRQIHKKAEQMTPTSEVIKDWPISMDPAVHAEAIQKLWTQGITDVYIHSAQPDQKMVIDFYGSKVLPMLKR